MKHYDFLFLLPGALSESEVPGVLENIKMELAAVGAEDIIFFPKGRQKLAYAIRGNHFAYLIESSFSLAPDKFKGLKEKLNLEPEILRFMITGHQEKETVRVRPLAKPALEKAPLSETEGQGQMDLKEIDRKIDEILQQDNIVI